MGDDYYPPDYYPPDTGMFPQGYSRQESGGLVIIASLVVLAIIIAIIFIALYFTCTSPFGGSDKCKCKSSKGKWDSDKEICTCPSGKELLDNVCMDNCKTGEIRDSTSLKCLSLPPGGSTPTCTSNQELISGSCVAKCVSGQTRDSTGKCILSCPVGKVSNGLACVDDLTGNWLGYVTSTNKSAPVYDWNIKHTTGGVAIYSGTILKTNTVLDGTTIMWGTVKGTWDPLARRITWSNDSHWIKQT